ncbi:MAG: ABC transporter ATP-binding protein [Deltaproteobacteria bacterium RIFCSPLOWO2_02_FULL_44_10]|nr:MAG: ABC transporter ATP-binding protein [Deltaproteobacteria bacterium RIFCSPHIGHO2_02_FULL_44_16]OGQ44988.1 MAG: ABC transporter ATP-binding protein [Deltaproteobacteria bacterium RIFCSPLOWO2_02_FULL_44_10]
MIELKNIHKSFGKQKVLRGIDLTIPKGKITVILGASGCGKTVLLRHIIGLFTPEQGKVIVDGTDINKLSRHELNEFRKRFGMVFQHAALFDSLTVTENIAFPLVEHDRERDPKKISRIVKEKLKLVGLPDAAEKMPSELSGGMRKRVGLARALALEPRIILYDEPTTGLDPIMTVAIDNLILSMQQELSVTSVVISHDIQSSLRVADQIAMMHEGKVIECAPPEAFQASPQSVVQDFLQAAHRANHKGRTQ